MLPNESLLETLHFADYITLVLAKLAGAPFLRVATKYAAELPHRRSFHVTFRTAWLTYVEFTPNARPTNVRYDPGNKSSLAAACRELGGVIGPHAVGKLSFSKNTWNMRAVRVIFEAAPQLKHAEDVSLHSPHGSAIANNCGAFMHTFAGMRALRLRLDYDVFRQFGWTFLRRESARELRLIKFIKTVPWTGKPNSFIEELVRYCVTLPHLGPLELDFTEYDFSGTFDLRIIELLKNSGRELTFRMRTLREGGELMLDGSDFTVDVDGSTTRYTSEKSGIVVEVEGPYIAIQSTAEVLRKKPRTTEEVLPATPFVE